MTALRMQGLASKVFGPKRVKKYSEVEAALEEWELNVKHFQNAEQSKMSPQTMVYSVRQIVPQDLENDIIRSNTLNTYQEVRAYISEQVPIRKDMKNMNTGPAHSEMDILTKTLAEMSTYSEKDHGGPSCGGGFHCSEGKGNEKN